MDIVRLGGMPGRCSGRSLDADLSRRFLTFFESHVDPPFVRVYTGINFRAGGRSAGTSASSRPTDSPAFHDPSAL